MRILAWVVAVPLLMLATPARADDALPPSTCAIDADCDAGVCFRFPDCDGGDRRQCLPSALLGTHEYCGCDGALFTRGPQSVEPFLPWQPDLAACGVDAGPSRGWQSQPWAVHYDDAGALLEPDLAAAEVQPSVAKPPAGVVCEGALATLLPPAERRFPERRPEDHLFVGCARELPIVTWSAQAITVRVPPNTPSGCVVLAAAASEEDLALQRHLFSDAGALEPVAARAAGDAARLPNGAFCLERCTRGPDGAWLNALPVGRPPRLELTTISNNGPAVPQSDGGLEFFIEGQGLLAWRAAGPVFLGGQERPPQDTVVLTDAGVLTLSTSNACGTTVRTVSVSTALRLETATQLVLQPGPTRITVALPVALPAPASLRVSAPAGVQAPDSVQAQPGARQVSFEVQLSRDAGQGALGPLLVSPPPGYVLGLRTSLVAAPPVRGFADLHVHQFADLAFGGVGVFGQSAGETATSLRDCSEVHGRGGISDVIGSAVKWGVPGTGLWGHNTGGWASFRGWPDALDYSHQQVHAEALHRAWVGGLRLMVMMAVNSKLACQAQPDLQWKKSSCDDMDALHRQLEAAQRFEQTDGQGWYHIVRTAREARETIARGGLAVVLGAELDNLGGCVADTEAGRHCTGADAQRLVTELAALGVRHVFPIHFQTNGFGGSALSNPLTRGAPHEESFDCGGLGYDYRPGLLGPPACNRRGLSSTGEAFVQALMANKLIIDLDHQSLQARSRTIELATAATYPLVSGHAWFFDQLQNGQRHEGTLRPEHARALRKLGGMFGVLTNQTDHRANLRPYAGPGSVPYGCGKSVEAFAQAYLYAVHNFPGPIALGSDFNGFAGQPSGRGKTPGSGALCLGDHPDGWVVDQQTTVTYPFVASSGQSLTASRVGARPYDIDTDGLAHIGMEPDFIEALRKLGVSQADLEPLLTSADGYVRMWEAIDARP